MLALLCLTACDRRSAPPQAQPVGAPLAPRADANPLAEQAEPAIAVIAVEVQTVSGPEREQHSGYPLYQVTTSVLRVFKSPYLPQERGGKCREDEELQLTCRWTAKEPSRFPFQAGMKMVLFCQRMWRDDGTMRLHDHGLLRGFIEGESFVPYEKRTQLQLERLFVGP